MRSDPKSPLANTPEQVTHVVGNLVVEALSQGAWAGPEHEQFRRTIQKHKTQYPDILHVTGLRVSWQDAVVIATAAYIVPDLDSQNDPQFTGQFECLYIAKELRRQIDGMKNLTPVQRMAITLPAKTKHGEGIGGKGEQFHVFLSHNSNNKASARDLKGLLAERGLNVWLDEDELRPGVSWQKSLEAAIKTSQCIVVLVGEDGLGPWQDEEMQAALHRAVSDKRPVIPVLLPGAPKEPQLPMFLENRTWVDLRAGFAEEGLLKLIWGITGRKPVQP